MVHAFWILAALDGMTLLTLLVLGLNERGHNDGGRELGLLFFVLLPMLILAAVCPTFWFVPVIAARWICFTILAIPGAFCAYLGVAQLGLRAVNDPKHGG